MKSFTIKNYKGNIVESLKKFQNKYPKSHILAVQEKDGALKVKVDESFTKAGEIHFDENGECRDNIKPIWHQILKYPKDEETIYANGNTYIYCVVMTSSLTEHFWAVYEGQDVRSKSDTSLPVPDYLIKHLPEGVETNESLDRHEDDELYFDVLNWFYDNYSVQNDITDKQWKDLANDIDKNAEVFMKLLDDLGLQGADDEVKDRAHELLVDFADAEL